ncbi:DUF493 domain-containing protein [bacterium]|nr:DUF493 domain-containing protein [bacterium]
MPLPPLELIKSTHEFPTDFVFKAIGNGTDFVAHVVAAARQAAGSTQDPRFTVRESTSGNHVAVTLHVPTQTADQVLVIYEALAKVQGLSLLL